MPPQVRLQRTYGEFKEMYDFLDPDADVELPDPLERCSEEEKAQRRAQFLEMLDEALGKGEFENMPDEMLQVRERETGRRWGMGGGGEDGREGGR